MPKKTRRKPSRDPKSDNQIAVRFAMIREIVGISRDDFRDALGISDDQLFRFESFRTPIPSDVALRACSLFIINESWLATCSSPVRPCVDLLRDPVFHKVDFRSPYSKVFGTEIMTKRYTELWESGPDKAFKKLVDIIDSCSSLMEGTLQDDILRLEYWLNFILGLWAVPAMGRAFLLRQLCDTGFACIKDHWPTTEIGVNAKDSPEPRSSEK